MKKIAIFILTSFIISCNSLNGEQMKLLSNPNIKNKHIYQKNFDKATRLDSLQGIWYGIGDDKYEILFIRKDSLFRIYTENKNEKDTSVATFFFIDDCIHKADRNILINKLSGASVLTIDIAYNDTSCFYIETLNSTKLNLLYERGKVHQYRKKIKS
jgi:hypothetical protein